MSLQNLYYKRTAATAKACYVCYKPTTIVLATIDTTDFLYTCLVHLTDPGFATRIKDDDNDKKVGVNAEEIARVKQEWEDKQKKKREKEKGKDDGDKADRPAKGENDKERAQQKASEEPSDKKPEAAGVGQPTTSPKPMHERYVLHRRIFDIRLAEHRRRRQAAQAKTLAPRLPGTPSNTMS
ncbi:VPS4-associated protein 1 [Pisolithus croceorrhizus]|nr:VPS4-associated protein 1 [Pisolithus croceorrhizus]KAI6128496.1 VPS4-associated protein 1 [Pisolithus croceorrhizus]